MGMGQRYAVLLLGMGKVEFDSSKMFEQWNLQTMFDSSKYWYTIIDSSTKMLFIYWMEQLTKNILVDGTSSNWFI